MKISKNLLRLSAVSFFILVLATRVSAKESPENLLLSLPSQIKTFVPGELRSDSHEKQLDASRPYHDEKGTLITVILYDKGLDIPTGIASETITQENKSIVSAIYTSDNYDDVITIDNKPKSFSLKNGKLVTTLFTAFSYTMTHPLTKETRSFYSEAYVTGLKGYICEFRITLPASQAKEQEGAIKEFLEEVFSSLQK